MNAELQFKLIALMFLVNAICNLMKNAHIESAEGDRRIKTLSCSIEKNVKISILVQINILIHNDGKTNAEHLDVHYNEVYNWIKGKNLTEVLKNPSSESKYQIQF